MHNDSKYKICEMPCCFLRNTWNEILQARKIVSPFLTFDFNKVLCKSFLQTGKINWIPTFYTFSINGKVKIIAPMLRKITRNGIFYESLGKYFRIPQYDFIYADDVTIDQLTLFVNGLKRKLGGYKLFFLNPKSQLYKCLDQSFPNYDSEIECGLILPKTYDAYFSSLSKNVRQTIRTARNRLTADSKTERFEIYEKGSIPSGKYSNFLNLYAKSYTERWNMIIDEKSKHYNTWFVKKVHPNAKGMRCLSNSICFMYYIDDELAAIIGGYIDEKRTSIVVPRIAYDEKFAKYSPGFLSLQKVIQYMFDKNIKILDLSKGNENYKLRMGCEEYYEYGKEI